MQCHSFGLCIPMETWFVGKCGKRLYVHHFTCVCQSSNAVDTENARFVDAEVDGVEIPVFTA